MTTDPAQAGTAPVAGNGTPALECFNLHKYLERRGLSLVRYADDMAIFVSSPRAGERVLASLADWMEKQLKVPVNHEKSGSGPSERSALPGFRLEADGTIPITPKSIRRLKAKVR